MVYRFTFRFLEVWPGLARNRSLHPAVRRPRPQNRHRHAAAWMLEASSAFFFCSSWWKNIGTWHMEWTRAVAMPTQSGCMGPNSCGSGLIKRIQKNHKLWRARWNYWNIVEVQSSGVQELFQNKWKRLLKYRWLQVLRNFRTRLSAMAVSDGKPKPDTLSFLVSVQRTPEGSDAWIQHRSEHVGFALDWHLWKRDQLKTNNFSNLSHMRGNWHQRSVKLRKWQILECTWIYRILFWLFCMLCVCVLTSAFPLGLLYCALCWKIFVAFGHPCCGQSLTQKA